MASSSSQRDYKRFEYEKCYELYQQLQNHKFVVDEPLSVSLDQALNISNTLGNWHGMTIFDHYYPDLVREFYANACVMNIHEEDTIFSSVLGNQMFITAGSIADLKNLPIGEIHEIPNIKQGLRYCDTDPSWSLNNALLMLGVMTMEEINNQGSTLKLN